jgi:hypothetical protein
MTAAVTSPAFVPRIAASAAATSCRHQRPAQPSVRDGVADWRHRGAGNDRGKHGSTDIAADPAPAVSDGRIPRQMPTRR